MKCDVPEHKYSLSIHWGLWSQRVQIELALAFRGISCDAHFLWLPHHRWTLQVWKLIHHPKAKLNIPKPNLISIRANGPDTGWLWNSSDHSNETITRVFIGPHAKWSCNGRLTRKTLCTHYNSSRNLIEGCNEWSCWLFFDELIV